MAIFIVLRHKLAKGWYKTQSIFRPALREKRIRGFIDQSEGRSGGLKMG
jgi:hypothetical protein